MLDGPANDAVLAGDVDDVAAHALVDHHPRRLAGDEERALGHHVVLQVPVALGGLEQRLGDRQPGVVDDEVDAAERQRRRRERRGDLLGRRDIHRHGDGAVRCRRSRRRPSAALPASRSATTTHAPSAASRSAIARPMPDPAPVTRAIARRQRLRLRQALQLRLLERPVLDAELLALGDRPVHGQRLGAAHHVDGIHVELAGHARRLLVLAEREHADAGHEHDRRVAPRIARRVGLGVPLVVGGVVVAVGAVQLAEALDDGRQLGVARAGRRTSGATLVRRKWSGHDVPSAASRGISARGEEVRGRRPRRCSGPTIGASVDAMPRRIGASAAARSLRAGCGRGSPARRPRRRTARAGRARR